MAVPSSAYNALMGLFSTRQPQNVSGSIYDMARADAQKQMLAQIGGGLMAAAVPQTATMRAQALQSAFGNMGNIGNSVYNAAQLRLAEQKQQQEAQLRNAAAERLKSLYGDGVAESVDLPSQPSMSGFGPRVQQPMQPSTQSEIGALVNPNQAIIAAPPAPSASASRPQRSSALTPAQIARVRGVEALEGPIAAANLASELQYSNAQPQKPLIIGDTAVDPSTFEVLYKPPSDVVKSEPMRDPDGIVYAYKNTYPSGEVKIEEVPQSPTLKMDAVTKTALVNDFVTKRAPAARISLSAIQNGLEAKSALNEGAYVGPNGAIKETVARALARFGITDTQLTATGKFRSAAGSQAVEMMTQFGGNDTDQEFVRAKEIVGANTELTKDQLNEIIDLQLRLAARKYNEGRNMGMALDIPEQITQLPSLNDQFGDVFDKNGLYKGVSGTQRQSSNLSVIPDAELDRLIAEEQAKMNSVRQSSLVPTGN